MAISFTLIQFEVGDKVIASIDFFDADDDYDISADDVLTIKDILKERNEDGDWTALVFEEVDGIYNEDHFYLHPSTIVRNIDPEK